jgi:hypothetical protein
MFRIRAPLTRPSSWLILIVGCCNECLDALYRCRPSGGLGSRKSGVYRSQIRTEAGQMDAGGVGGVWCGDAYWTHLGALAGLYGLSYNAAVAVPAFTVVRPQRAGPVFGVCLRVLHRASLAMVRIRGPAMMTPKSMQRMGAVYASGISGAYDGWLPPLSVFVL